MNAELSYKLGFVLIDACHSLPGANSLCSSHGVAGGHSAILDPMGIPVAFLNEEAEGIATTDVTHRRVEEVREFLPVLSNRRFEGSQEVSTAS